MKNEFILGLPIRCYDSGENSGPDRYTVVFMDCKLFVANPGMYAMVGMSGAPFHPQGIGQHCEGKLGKHLGKRIPFVNLPEDCRTLVLRDLQEAADVRILDCGHTPSEHSEHTTGTAHTSDNKEICWTCAALGELGRMLKTGKATLYWSNTKQYGWRVTNWPSSLMFDHTRVTEGRHNIGGTRDDVWFVGPDGYTWHGVQIGQWNQILHARRTKERTALPFNAVKEF